MKLAYSGHHRAHLMTPGSGGLTSVTSHKTPRLMASVFWYTTSVNHKCIAESKQLGIALRKAFLLQPAADRGHGASHCHHRWLASGWLYRWGLGRPTIPPRKPAHRVGTSMVPQAQQHLWLGHGWAHSARVDQYPWLITLEKPFHFW